MEFRIETEREADGRWIAEVPDLPGVLCYGETKERAVSRATALALQVLADRLENGEIAVAPESVVFLAASASGAPQRENTYCAHSSNLDGL
ncbi:MAG: type II toxin-antitoxin system HicB family antitoxin [Fimbriimonadales bacterium]